MRFDDLANPATWLLGSFLALVLATNVCWLAVRRYAANPAFRRGPAAAGGWVVLSLFYLLVPFAALQRGVISPYALGLTEVNWPATLSNGMVLAGIIVAGSLFGWYVYRRARLEAGALEEGRLEGQATSSYEVSGVVLPPALSRPLALLRAPLDAALDQWHWAFYRAAAIGWLLIPLGLPSAPLADRILQGLQNEPLYWGAWIGLGVAGLEWVLDPFARSRLRREGEREVTLRRVALAVATTGLFVLTRNFWLCLVVQVAVETLAVGWFPLPARAQVEVD